jgi:hypothetical protein
VFRVRPNYTVDAYADTFHDYYGAWQWEHFSGGKQMSDAAETAVISDYLTSFAAAVSGPYSTRVISGPGVPHLEVVSQVSPELGEHILVDFSTDPPGYLTAGGHQLGSAGNTAAAALALACLLRVTG